MKENLKYLLYIFVIIGLLIFDSYYYDSVEAYDDGYLFNSIDTSVINYSGLKVRENNNCFKYYKNHKYKKSDNISYDINSKNVIAPLCGVDPNYNGEIYVTVPYIESEDVDMCLYGERDLSNFKDKKLIAFTFDDGPSKKNTNKLLDSLDCYHARVTFFVLGSRVKSNKEVIKRAYNMGNQIGSHTYSHKDLNKLNSDQIRSEINNTNLAIKNVIGVSPKVLRPPYGNLNDRVKNISNMKIILWDIDTLDWKYKDPERIKNEIVNNAKDGSIILLHDLYETSIDGALLAMEELIKDNYAFVTIDEMVELKGVKLNNNKRYRYIR